MMVILLVLYLVIGYWAVGATVYANKIRFGTMEHLFISRLTIALVFGWLLIPVALIKAIFFR